VHYNVQGPRKVGLPESGLDLDITTGRPDIQRLLRDAVQGATGEEVPVVVAGEAAACPSSLLRVQICRLTT
jgi:hypothetical protein